MFTVDLLEAALRLRHSYYTKADGTKATYYRTQDSFGSGLEVANTSLAIFAATAGDRTRAGFHMLAGHQNRLLCARPLADHPSLEPCAQ